MENKDGIKQDEIKKSYYYTDIEPTIDNLRAIIAICETFEKEGGDRLLCAMDMRRWDLDEIERLTAFITQSRQKMEIELARLKRYKDAYNDMFATDHNGYYNSVANIMNHIRSHTSPLKEILKKTCNRKHPNRRDCQRYHIPSKSVHKESVLASGSFQRIIFGIDDPSIPTQVSSLFEELQLFFRAEKEGMQICKDILKQEEEIRKDPIKSKYVLDKYRHKAIDKLRNQIQLITDYTIDMLKEVNPAYRCYTKYASDEAFAQEEFHKHNIADMDHFCLIELTDAKRKDKLDDDELALFGNKPQVIKQVRYIIHHFDELLPEDFIHKKMGEYQYYFCKWAAPGNIRKATEYFNKHYDGKWKVSKYAAVSSHSKDYDQHSASVENFQTAINCLLKKANLIIDTAQSA
jgi:hypothetical protein